MSLATLFMHKKSPVQNDGSNSRTECLLLQVLQIGHMQARPHPLNTQCLSGHVRESNLREHYT